MSEVDNDAKRTDEERAAYVAWRQERNLPAPLYYSGESPDEIAFVKVASDCGYMFEGSDRNIYNLRTPYTTGKDNQPDRYTVLAMNHFDHKRRAMSVLVQCPGGAVKLLMKGAGSAVLPLAANTKKNGKHQKHIAHFGTFGLRTLAVAVRDVPEKEAQRWLRIHNDAASQISGRQEALTAAAKLIEQQVEVIGITAIEGR